MKAKDERLLFVVFCPFIFGLNWLFVVFEVVWGVNYFGDYIYHPEKFLLFFLNFERMLEEVELFVVFAP